ncbi:transient receptor potential cation channel subfamily V member 5-like [Lineus longissimus]|uniref:transient receptor potential cation channel subfamily V member 5-like n=1 Tax=Lineus longissimus TaxID=88925 RepID=UPI00315D0673
MRHLRVKKPNPAVFHICIPYNAHEEGYHQDADDVELQLDALLLQLNTGEYLQEGDGDTEDEMLGTESETMLAEARFGETHSVASTDLLEHGISSRSLNGIENAAVEGDAPLASIDDALAPSPKKTELENEGERQSVRSCSAAELPTTATNSAVWPPLRSDSLGDTLDYSRVSLPSYPDSTHDFFKPPTSKAREVIKQFLKDGDNEKVFQLLNRALKSDLNLDNAIYRILDILERWDVDIASDCFIEKGTSASLLHTALLFRKENATKRLVEQFPDLLYVNYTSKKYKDQTCFHIAVANNDCGLISKMLCSIKDRSERKALLNTVAGGDYFNHERPEASTCLSAAAWMGQLDMIERLIVEGADLELRGVGGNTLLHFIVMLSIKKLNMLTARKLFKAVYENSGWWWGDAKDIGTSVDNESLKREAFRYLMRIPNDAGLTPAALAVQLHSPLTGFILSLEPVFKLQQSELGEMGAATYDVTGVLSFTPSSDGMGRWHYNVGSILHTLAHTDKVIATDKSDGTIKDVAEMEPISSAIQMKWKVYRWIYLIWFIVHALFMTVLTSTALHHHDTKSKNQDGPVFGLFLPLPLVYLVFEAADFSYTMYSYIMTFGEPRSAIIAFFKQQLITTGNIPYRVVLIVFSWCMLVWCGMYHQGNLDHAVPLSMALVLGWIFMLFFCRGCRHVCRFATMVQRMIFRDLLFFLAVYLFIVIGFSAAVHVLLPEGQGQGHRQTTSMTFFLMLNVINNMDTSPIGQNTLHGDYARLLLGAYGIVSAVLLLSLLISMMNTTYVAVKSSDVNLWRYQQLSIMLLLERRFFWWTKLCRLSQNAAILRFTQDITDPERRTGRVYMNIQEHIKH